MIRHFLAATAVFFFARSITLASTLLPVAPYGPYRLSALPLFDGGTLAPDTAPSLYSETPTGYSLGALDYSLTSRAARVASWTGARSIGDGVAQAVVTANAGVVAIPDEGERSGDPLTLYVHLVAKSHGGDAAYQLLPTPSQLLVEARVKPNANLPWQSFTGPGVIPISAVIGKQIELSLSVRASAGELIDDSFDTYAALDLQLYLSYDTNPPPDLAPRPVVPGDATLDGLADGADYTVWADHYLQATTQGALAGDFNRDGLIDGGDYTIWADHYSPDALSLAASPVSEPGTLLLATIGVVGLLSTIGRRSMSKILGGVANNQ